MRLVVMAAGLWCTLVAPSWADSLSTTGNPSPADTFELDSSFVADAGDITDFRWLPDGRIVIITKSGTVSVRPAGGGSLVQAGTFSVDTASEKGLLGVAVDPQFATNQRLYFYYSANGAAPLPGSVADRQRVVMRVLPPNNQLGQETLLLHDLRGPANHDGGALDIGPDGLLYVGVGDTGNNSSTVPEPPYTPTNFYGTCLADDPTQHGAGNGKILRISLDGSIPSSNPLVGATDVTACGPNPSTAISPGHLGAPRVEIFAWGFRNPFRLWVDPMTGKVWAGDVGEISYEEITIVEPGRHHGWPWREGRHGWPTSKCQDVRIGTTVGNAPIQDQDCVEPVYFCRHDGIPSLDVAADGGCTAITGGQIVDSCDWPEPFRGRYYFADSSEGTIFALTPNAARDGITGGRVDIGSVTGYPVALHTGNDGALYVAVLGGQGRIARMTPKSPIVCSTTNTTLSGSTTTTTLDACAALTGAERVACQLDAASMTSLCSSATVDATLASTIHDRFRTVATVVRRVIDATPKATKRLLQRTDRRLRTLLPKLRRADRRDRLDTNCRSEIEALVGRLREAIASL